MIPQYHKVIKNHMKLTVNILRNLTLCDISESGRFITIINKQPQSSDQSFSCTFFAITNVHQKHTVKAVKEKLT